MRQLFIPRPPSGPTSATFLRHAQLLRTKRVLAYCGDNERLSGAPRRGLAEQRLSSIIRILIADDFKDWRRQVQLLLRARPELQVIAETSDGLEAIRKAEVLRPDLVLLDISLPKLNGIEAARRIRQLSPGSKIVFLSQNSDREIVQTALGTGAEGYVYKSDAQSELLPALNAVLLGKSFVSGGLKDRMLTDSPGEKAPHRHEVQFYSDDTILLDRLARFIAAALKSGNAAIVIATKSHRYSLLQRLKAEDVDTDGMIQQGTYISLDVADMLSRIMVKDSPDPVLFFAGFGGLIEAAAKAAKLEQPRVVVFGEGVALLKAQGKVDAAIRLEQLASELAKKHAVDILCAYPMSSFQNEEDEHVFKSICAEHSAVYSQ
jgi:DNA-binding NarL/FixJ family response regulator